MSIFNKIKKTFSPKKFNPGDQIKNELNKFKGTVKREIIQEIKGEVIGPLEDKIDKIENKAKDAAEKVIEEIIKAISSQAFKQVVRWIEVFAPSQASLSLGPVEFGFELKDRLGYLKGLVKHPPKNKQGIIKVIRTLAPSEVTVSASVNLALGIGSRELGVGGALTVETEKFINKIDSVL